MQLRDAPCDPYMPIYHCTFYMRFSSEGGKPRGKGGGREKRRTCSIRLSLSQNGNRLNAAANRTYKRHRVFIVIDIIRARAGLKHRMVITGRGAPTRPPPGAEIGEGGAEIVMATI